MGSSWPDAKTKVGLDCVGVCDCVCEATGGSDGSFRLGVPSSGEVGLQKAKGAFK